MLRPGTPVPQTWRRPRLFAATLLAGISALVLSAGATATPTPNTPAVAPISLAKPVAECTPTTPPVTGSSVRHVTAAGISRTYRLHVPIGYSGRTRHPLILAFHGRTDTGASMENYSQLSTLPAIVAYPDGLVGAEGQTAWQGAPYAHPMADDISFTRSILRDLRASFCIDTDRTFAVGWSNGAGLVSMLSCRTPHDFAAYAVVSGAFYSTGEKSCATPKPVSLISFHGTADPIIHYNGGIKYLTSYQSVDYWLSRRAEANACSPFPVSAQVAPKVTRNDWSTCLAVGQQIAHYRIDGAGHRWPGSPINHTGGAADNISATATIWQFFTDHPSR